MSLLNQVLQDLENRKADTNSGENYLDQLKVVPEQSSQSTYRLLFVIGLLGLFLIALSWLLINHYKHDTSEETPTLKEQTKTYNIKQSKGQLIIDEKHQNSTTVKASIVKKIKPEATIKHPPLNKKIKATEPKKETKQTTVVTEQPRQLAAVAKGEKMPVLKTERQQRESRLKTIHKNPFDPKKQAKQLFQLTKQQSSQKLKQEKLLQVLELDNKHLPARLLLAQILNQRGQAQKSTFLLDQGLKLFPGQLQLIKLRSQLHLQQNQAQQAIKQLQTITDKAQQDENYLALLAAAYQQNQQYADAQLLYQQLVQLRPQQAQYWLGLGLAYDKQDNQDPAFKAYQQALNKNTLQATVVSYIKQRLSILK